MDTGTKDILLLSVYWDGTFKNTPPEFERALIIGRKENYKIIFGGDVNARSELWRCENADRRGERLEELFANYDMELANRGQKPTCTASDKGSIIDITAVSDDASYVQDWKVIDLDSHSDHKIIKFNIEYVEEEPKRIRKMNDEQRAAFTRETRGLAFELDDLLLKGRYKVQDAEDISNKLVTGISKAYTKNSTEYKVKIMERPNIFKIPEVYNARKELRRLRHYYKNRGQDPDTKQPVKDQKKHLKTTYKKHKLEERRGNLTKIIDQKDMARLTNYAKMGQ